MQILSRSRMVRLSLLALAILVGSELQAVLWARCSGSLPTVSLPAWVPFSAKVEARTTAGPSYWGRFYQRTDGSTRSDTGQPGKGIDRILINNATDRMQYEWARERGWTSAPLDLPPQAWYPPVFVDSLMRSLEPIGRKESGLDILALNRESGESQWYAPQLNLFMIRWEFPPCSVNPIVGCDELLRYYDVKIAAQPDAFFKPPVGEYVNPLAQPAELMP